MASWFKRIAFSDFGVFFAVIAMRLLFLTCKKKFLGNSLPQKSCIVVFWHGRLALMSFAYEYYWSKFFHGKKNGKVIISDHKDGELITKIIKFFKIGAIRGSSSKGGAKAVISAIKEAKQGTDIIITPDGPRGPRHSVANGAIAIAKKLDCEIYALNYEASSFWQFKSWDKMILPKPFCTITFYLSKPFKVTNLEQKDAKALVQDNLWKLSEKCGGKSIKQNREDFLTNLNQWWNKNKSKNPIIDSDLEEILREQNGY